MADKGFLLDARGITKSYGPTHVLRGMDFAVAPGEVHAFLGGNGAGKSTLLKIVADVVNRDGGTLNFDGHSVDEPQGAAARARGLAIVHQELAVLPHLTVAENIELPHYHRGLALFDRRAADRTALSALALIDRDFAEHAAHRLVGDLSLHEQQMVEIARALKSGARLLLLDEPTTNLTAGEAQRLFAVLRRLVSETEIGVVFVSHRMREIRQVADVCTIIRDGVAAVHRKPVTELTDADIVELMGQASALTETPVGGELPAAVSAAHVDAPRLKIEGLGFPVEVGGGAILGLAGAPAGPQALIDLLIGAAPLPGVVIRIGDHPQGYRSPREAVRDKVGFVSGDRANRGMLSALPIIDNMLASRRIVERRVLVSGKEAAQARSLLSALSIKASSYWALPSSLSGGTQQKLIIARWLQLQPRMLVLEEPTRGVDIGTKRDIYALIRVMAQAGTTIVWWSTEQTELVELCDTVLGFGPDGRATQLLHGAEITEERLAEATGMAA
ncbi:MULTISPECIES: ATP-binding cassette domain-containing protein [unclassified Acidisoma]|jgi:ribose transport system ATP-binding protein|uniref:ATP-binding cassette domain-containing protein n=1 Tax=unclassified Acidisoma TaxID=2634065 RepID=UPI00131D4600|nr:MULTISPECIES: sugar ABC transporter ATP-binding protein [unclassified Acidisoma]